MRKKHESNGALVDIESAICIIDKLVFSQLDCGEDPADNAIYNAWQTVVADVICETAVTKNKILYYAMHDAGK